MAPTGRKLSKRACDGCKIRKIKCSGTPPCAGCAAAGVGCTFNKHPATRGPRSLRAKTIHQIAQAQELRMEHEARGISRSASVPEGAPSQSPSDSRTSPDFRAPSPTSPPEIEAQSTTPIHSLVLRLCVYRLRLFPVWPIVAVEEVMASLHRDVGDMESYALANAVGAATIAQLKLERSNNEDTAAAAAMESECQRARGLLQRDGREPPVNLNALRISFFLHVYHENKSPGGFRSLLYLREAITIAQIMGLHKTAAYEFLPSGEQQMRRRILWLLFITERGVAMLHKLPVVLKCNIPSFSLDDVDDETHVLPAFRKLVNLFWIFDQSGAFDILQNTDDSQFPLAEGMGVSDRSCIDLLPSQLREISLDSEPSNDIQRADICVTRQWMQVILWRASMNRGRGFSDAQQATSLSHPIQIAKEFLETVSRLPSAAMEAHGPAMEYKIYEIARAVTDSVANDMTLLRNSGNRPQDILNELQRKLASYRGGNKSLLSLLRARIAEVQGGPLMIMNIQPSAAIVEELSDSPPLQADEVPPIEEGIPANSATPRGVVTPPRPSHFLQARDGFGRQSTHQDAFSGGTPPDLQISRPPWEQGFGNDFSPSFDLFNQLQTLDGTFNNVESAETVGLFLGNTTQCDTAVNWDWLAGGASNGPIFNQTA